MRKNALFALAGCLLCGLFGFTSGVLVLPLCGVFGFTSGVLVLALCESAASTPEAGIAHV